RDWSSDVCSSDLGIGVPERIPALLGGCAEVRVQDREEERGLAREVRVDRALGVPGTVRDLLEVRPVVSLLGEALARRPDQGVTSLLLSIAPRGRGGMRGHGSMIRAPEP